MTETTDEKEGMSNVFHHEGSGEEYNDECPDEPSVIQIVQERKDSLHRILIEEDLEPEDLEVPTPTHVFTKLRNIEVERRPTDRFQRQKKFKGAS